MSAPWKKAFFALLFFNISVLLVLLFLGFSSVDLPLESEAFSVEEKDRLSLELSLSSKELEDLLKLRLETLGLPLRIKVKEEIWLIYPMEIYGKKLEVIARGKARVKNNGRVQIILQETRLGNLAIPNSMALKALAILLPEASPIGIEDGQIIEMDFSLLSESYQIKAKSFSPKEDRYTFTVLLDQNILFN